MTFSISGVAYKTVLQMQISPLTRTYPPAGSKRWVENYVLPPAVNCLKHLIDQV